MGVKWSVLSTNYNVIFTMQTNKASNDMRREGRNTARHKDPSAFRSRFRVSTRNGNNIPRIRRLVYRASL